MGEMGPASSGEKNTFSFTQLEVNDHLGGGLSLALTVKWNFFFFFFELEAYIHSYLEEHLCLQKV